MAEARYIEEEVCAEVLDLFLQDMEELDCQQSVARADREMMAVDDNASRLGQKREQAQELQERVKAAPKRRKKNSQTWIRRKQELMRLRRQTQEMESQITVLQFQRAEKRHELSLLPESAEVQQWHLLATKEKKRCLASQLQNLNLKAQLRAHIQVSNTLHAKVPYAKRSILSSALCYTVPIPPQLQISSSRTIRVLEERLDRRTLELQTILKDLQHAPTTMNSIQIQVYNGEDNTARIMQCNYAQVLPFNEVATFNAAWGVGKVNSIPQKQHFQVVKQSGNACVVDARFVFALRRGGTVTVDIHCIKKRFTVPEGSILLSESISEWSALQEDVNLWSNTTRESVYFVARDYPLGLRDRRKSYLGPACQINTVVRSEASQRHTPSHAQNATSNPTTPDFLVSSFHELIELQRQFFENMLMDSVH